MFPILAQNGIGGEFIVWLIIGFFWIVAQLFSRARGGRARELAPDRNDRQPAPQEEARSLEQEMRRFFEELGAEPPEVQEERPAAPVRRAAPPPMPRERRSSTAARSRGTPQRLRRDAEPRRERWTQVPVHVQQDVQLGAIDTTLDESALDTDRAYSLPDMHRDENINAFVNPRTLLVNLNYLRMNMPIIPITGLSTTGESRPLPQLKGRAALRNAITAQLILSNPLAMGEDKGSYTKRIV